MTLARLDVGFALSLAALSLVACDAKDGSVSGTATTAGDPSGSTSGSTGGDPSATGVDPGDTEDPSGSSTGGSFDGQCEQNATIVGLDDATPVDLTGQELLDSAVGAYAGAMQWMQEGPVQFEGDPGPTGLEIEIAYQGGEARSIEGVLLTPCMHDGPCPCPDSLEVDVQLRIDSEDGVFDEVFDAQLVYTVDESGFGGRGTNLRVRFDPDETSGTFSSGALDISGDSVLEYLEFRLEPGGGALSGSLNASVEMLGGIGFGVIASLGAVQELDACAVFRQGGSACSLAGCTEVDGTPVYGNAETCSCSEPQSYCFPAPLEGDDVPTRYTREFEDGFEVFEEVVEFGVSAELGGDWRACADAPEVAVCGCEDAC